MRVPSKRLKPLADGHVDIYDEVTDREIESMAKEILTTRKLMQIYATTGRVREILEHSGI